MWTTRLSSGEPNLSPVLGLLTGEQRGRILRRIEAADARLGEVAETLRAKSTAEWRYEGIVLSWAESGQISFDVLLEESTGKLSFTAQLRPGNFFPSEDEMWQPGKPPLKMATDAWDVDGSVAVRFKTRVGGRPARIQQQVVELAERHLEDPVEAGEAFAGLCDELAELALSREPTVEAWRPPEQDAGDAPRDTTPAASI